jgi:hypothetical protein
MNTQTPGSGSPVANWLRIALARCVTTPTTPKDLQYEQLQDILTLIEQLEDDEVRTQVWCHYNFDAFPQSLRPSPEYDSATRTVHTVLILACRGGDQGGDHKVISMLLGTLVKDGTLPPDYFNISNGKHTALTQLLVSVSNDPSDENLKTLDLLINCDRSQLEEYSKGQEGEGEGHLPVAALSDLPLDTAKKLLDCWLKEKKMDTPDLRHMVEYNGRCTYGLLDYLNVKYKLDINGWDGYIYMYDGSTLKCAFGMLTNVIKSFDELLPSSLDDLIRALDLILKLVVHEKTTIHDESVHDIVHCVNAFRHSLPESHIVTTQIMHIIRIVIHKNKSAVNYQEYRSVRYDSTCALYHLVVKHPLQKNVAEVIVEYMDVEAAWSCLMKSIAALHPFKVHIILTKIPVDPDRMHRAVCDWIFKSSMVGLEKSVEFIESALCYKPGCNHWQKLNALKIEVENQSLSGSSKRPRLEPTAAAAREQVEFFSNWTGGWGKCPHKKELRCYFQPLFVLLRSEKKTVEAYLAWHDDDRENSKLVLKRCEQPPPLPYLPHTSPSPGMHCYRVDKIDQETREGLIEQMMRSEGSSLQYLRPVNRASVTKRRASVTKDEDEDEDEAPGSGSLHDVVCCDPDYDEPRKGKGKRIREGGKT